MKGFIEVTDFESGYKILVPIAKITGVMDDFGGAVYIEMGTNREEESLGILVSESFDEIKRKISACEASFPVSYIA